MWDIPLAIAGRTRASALLCGVRRQACGAGSSSFTLMLVFGYKEPWLKLTDEQFFFSSKNKTQLENTPSSRNEPDAFPRQRNTPGPYRLHVCSLRRERAAGRGLPWKTGGVRFRFTSYERLWFGGNHSVRVLVWLLWRSRRGGMWVPERLRWLLRVRMANRFLFPGFVFVLG